MKKLLFLFFLSALLTAKPYEPTQLDLQIISDTFNEELKQDSITAKRYPPKRIYTTSRINNEPEIDGKLNDECWKGGGWDNFTFQKEPVDGGIPTEKTLFKVVYDDNNIYAAARCCDSEPNKIDKILSVMN